MTNQPKLNKLIEEKMKDTELDDVEFLHGVPVHVTVETKEKIEQAMLSLVLEILEELMMKEPTNEYWMKEKNIPSSDFSYGYMHGYNLAVQQLNHKIKELTEVEE